MEYNSHSIPCSSIFGWKWQSCFSINHSLFICRSKQVQRDSS